MEFWFCYTFKTVWNVWQTYWGGRRFTSNQRSIFTARVLKVGILSPVNIKHNVRPDSNIPEFISLRFPSPVWLHPEQEAQSASGYMGITAGQQQQQQLLHLHTFNTVKGRVEMENPPPVCVCCVTYLHVLCDWCITDSVGSSRNGGLAAVAATAAVQAGHVDPVQVVMVLPPPVAHRLILAVLATPADITQICETNLHQQREPCPIWLITDGQNKWAW